MRKTREILRLKFDSKLTQRLIATACDVSPATVWDCLSRFKASGLQWPLPDEIDDGQLDARMYSSAPAEAAPERVVPDWTLVNREMRKKHVTLMLVWQEYKAQHPDGYQYSWFCEQYGRFQQVLDLVMRQEHKLGEKCFVDYAGDTMEIVDGETGVVQAAHVFIGVLGASSYTYAEASLAEDLPSWIGAHVRMFEFFGGVPEILVPDNLKCGVTTPNYYEPDLNLTYQEMAEHYEVAVVPARMRRPRDKAKAENGVLLAERWVMAALRNRTFFSLAELNAAIREKIEVLNQRPFQKLPGSRCSIFEQEERAALRPLPLRRYQYADRKQATVHIDYHVELDGHYYSVPYILARKSVEIRWTSATVEVIYHHQRVASHVRSYVKGKATTLLEHMPPRHRSQAEWTPERMVAWAAKRGEWTAKLVDGIMANCQHPEQGFRSCLGVMRLGDKYGAERLEAACRRAVTMKGYRYKIVKSILEHNLDQPSENLAERQPVLPCIHENVRGAEYYH